MAGSISLSLSQQFDSTGAPLNGGLLYFYAAGTTTPQSAYQDSSLTLAWPNPIVLDSAGRVPPFYLADGQIKIRLTDSAGVTQVSADNLLVVGASSGSGSAPTVDATTVLQTGDVKARYGVGAHTGWVRANARTIGSGSSGGTERANSDCQSLFEYLWTADTSLTVSTGRGISANADWVANKTITLPDARGLAMAGLDDMGNSARGIFTGATFGRGNATSIGSVLGASRTTLSAASIPPLTSTGSNSISVLSARTDYVFNALGVTSTSAGLGGANGLLNSTSGGINQVSSSGTNSISVTTTGTSGSAFDTISPYMLVTLYLKL